MIAIDRVYNERLNVVTANLLEAEAALVKLQATDKENAHEKAEVKLMQVGEYLLNTLSAANWMAPSSITNLYMGIVRKAGAGKEIRYDLYVNSGSYLSGRVYLLGFSPKGVVLSGGAPQSSDYEHVLYTLSRFWASFKDEIDKAILKEIETRQRKLNAALPGLGWMAGVMDEWEV